MKLLFYSTQDYDRKYFNQANKHFNMTIDYFDGSLNKKTVKLGYQYDAICLFVNDICDDEVVAELYHHGTKCILLRCAGYNNVAIDKAKALGVKVARVPEYSPYAVAEHAVGLLLCLNRKIHKAYNRIREGNFSLKNLEGMDLCGKTIGIVGYGKIGKVFHRIMSGFSCKILIHDPYITQVDSETSALVSLDTLLAQSDIISLHCPLLEETYHIINDKTLALIKNGAIIINTSRGALIDTKAIIKSLKNKHLGGLAIDVYEEESELFFKDHSEEIIADDQFERLLTFPNVLVTGHQAFLTHEALVNIANVTLNNAKQILENSQCNNIISK